MTPVYLLIGFSVVVFSATAVYALWWAARTGQFQRYEQGALVIFDDGEPVGEPTDAFPGIDPKAPEARPRRSWFGKGKK